MFSNPWASISRPQGVSYFRTRRVDASVNPTDLPVSWAIDFRGNKAVYFEYPSARRQKKEAKPPTFSSLSVRDIEINQAERAFAIILEENEMADLFYEICCDLIASLQDMPPEATRTVLVRRLERWSSLLKGKRTGLSRDAQRGLFAELLFMERVAIPNLGEMDAVRGWVGPELAHQDYRYGQTFIEVKSKHGASSNEVRISSEHQLAVNSAEKLFLYVVEENDANGQEGLTLDNLVSRIRKSLRYPLSRSEFASKLLAVGYSSSDVYDSAWAVGLTSVYEVRDDFPRITDAGIGLSHISYSLDLKVCSEYESSVGAIENCLRSIHD